MQFKSGRERGGPHSCRQAAGLMKWRSDDDEQLGQCKFIYAEERGREEQKKLSVEDDDRSVGSCFIHNLRRFDCSSVLPFVDCIFKRFRPQPAASQPVTAPSVFVAVVVVVVNKNRLCYSLKRRRRQIN